MFSMKANVQIFSFLCSAEDPSLVPNVMSPAKDPLIPSTTKLNKDWNTVNKFLRPRSFCLEHAVEIVELLQSKGGANVLVICHSGNLENTST